MNGKQNLQLLVVEVGQQQQKNVMRKSFWSFVVYAKWNGDSTHKKHKHNPNYLSSVEFTKN
jgi:hypothetical protein